MREGIRANRRLMLTALAAAGFVSSAKADVSYLGVAAGDAGSNDAILWTRAVDSTNPAATPLTALVSTTPTFDAGTVSPFAGTTSALDDYTLHLNAIGLQSGTQYYYKFQSAGGATSTVGTFKTAPAPTAAVPLHFGFSGDADGQWRPYTSTSNVTSGVPGFAQQNFIFFTWLGDTIYETASGGTGPNASPAVPNSTDPATLLPAYWTKYRQQFQPVSTGSYPGLSSFFSSTGHYTLLDNHELGNKQYINGGAPPGTAAGAGVDATNPANDVNTTGTYINQTPGFKALVQAYTGYQPIRTQTVIAPTDLRSNNTQQLYFSQQWGKNAIFVNVDDRSYRDIRMKTSAGADDTGPRGDNPNRTMLGQTQLNWLEQTLSTAQTNGTPWKFVAVSSPIDAIGAIGSGADGGKAWMGEYRAERNTLLKYIADNHITNVVFLSTDDHQTRINELTYSPSGQTSVQSSYVRVPGVFEIVTGPIGAGGPDAITDHSFANIQSLANALANQQQSAGVDPIGLDSSYFGLKVNYREGDANATSSPSPVDFYSPDTFNYSTLDVSADGQTLTVQINGTNSYGANTFPQPDASNPVREILNFQVSAVPEPGSVAAVALAMAGLLRRER